MLAGIDVGWRTPGFASATVTEALAETQVTFPTPSGDVVLDGDALGLSVDAEALAVLVHTEHPLWKVGAWNPGSLPIEVSVDRDATLEALTSAAPEVFPARVDAGVRYDSVLGRFTPSAALAGLGVDITSLEAAVSRALSTGSLEVTFDTVPVPIQPSVSTEQAVSVATSLNEIVESAGFYLDGTKIVGLDSAMVASWLTVTDDGGDLRFEVDTVAAQADVSPLVASLPAIANREPVTEVVVTNSSGAQLRTVQAGADGWRLDSTRGITAAFLESLSAGDSRFELTGRTVPHRTDLVNRTIEVNQSTGQTILFENGQVVDTFPVAVGKSSTPTPEGHFTVFVQYETQDMGCVAQYDYCTPGVPWVTYFAGDNAFHGTYWHDTFGAGARVSHGCINMTIEAAQRLYYFAQLGTEVWVHS